MKDETKGGRMRAEGGGKPKRQEVEGGRMRAEDGGKARRMKDEEKGNFELRG